MYKKKTTIFIVCSIAFFILLTFIIIAIIPGNFIESGIVEEVMNSSGEYEPTQASESLYSAVLAILCLGGSAVGFIALYQFASVAILKDDQRRKKFKEDLEKEQKGRE